jgi:hypothetical protein
VEGRATASSGRLRHVCEERGASSEKRASEEGSDKEGEEEERSEDARIGAEAGGSVVCDFGWIEEEGWGWKKEVGRGERIRQRGARVPPNFIPRKCDWSRRISDGRPQIVGPLGRTGLVSFLLYLIFSFSFSFYCIIVN